MYVWDFGGLCCFGVSMASRAILFLALTFLRSPDGAGEDHGVGEGLFHPEESSHMRRVKALPSPWQAAHPAPGSGSRPPELHPAGLSPSQDLIISLRRGNQPQYLTLQI